MFSLFSPVRTGARAQSARARSAGPGQWLLGRAEGVFVPDASHSGGWLFVNALRFGRVSVLSCFESRSRATPRFCRRTFPNALHWGLCSRSHGPPPSRKRIGCTCNPCSSPGLPPQTHRGVLTLSFTPHRWFIITFWVESDFWGKP